MKQINLNQKSNQIEFNITIDYSDIEVQTNQNIPFYIKSSISLDKKQMLEIVENQLTIKGFRIERTLAFEVTNNSIRGQAHT